MGLDNIIRTSAFPADTNHQVKMVTEDFREFLKKFDQKNREYGGENAFVLGSAGQFADIWRKIGKLKTALWDKKPEQLTSEGTEEIIQDLIGHLFLTLQCLRRDEEAAKTPSLPISDQGMVAKGDLIGWSPGVLVQNFQDVPLETISLMAGVDPEAERIRSIKRLEYEDMMAKKRHEVRLLYPQISEASLQSRDEASLNWLISAAKPEEDKEDVDPREYKFGPGQTVRNLNKNGWLANAVGVVRKVDRASAGLWYIVDFDSHHGGHGITMSERTLELVK